MDSCHLQIRFDFLPSNLDDFSFSYLITLARISGTVTSRSDGSRHPCLAPDLRRIILLLTTYYKNYREHHILTQYQGPEKGGWLGEGNWSSFPARWVGGKTSLLRSGNLWICPDIPVWELTAEEDSLSIADAIASSAVLPWQGRPLLPPHHTHEWDRQPLGVLCPTDCVSCPITPELGPGTGQANWELPSIPGKKGRTGMWNSCPRIPGAAAINEDPVTFLPC